MLDYTKRCRALLALFTAGLVSAPTYACLEIPPVPPDIWIVVTGPNHADIVIHDFTTYGATAGSDYCACALNVPALYGNVVSAQIVDSNTGVPLPGFSFGPDPDTQSGFQGAAPLTPPEFWSGFSSAVASTIAAGLPVDIVFQIHSPDRPFDWNGLADHFNGASAVLATDAASPDGTPTGAHQSIQPAGSVGVEVNMFGMPNRPLGQATLTRSGGRLVVSNIGSSGKDGVRFVPPPDLGGAGVQIGPDSCPAGGNPPGNGLGMRQFNVDSFFDIEYRVQASGNWGATVNVPTPPACMRVQVYDHGELQLDECVPPGLPLVDFPGDVCLAQLAWLPLPSPRMRLLLDQPTPIQVPGAPAAVTGNEMHIFNPDELLTPPDQFEIYARTDSFFDVWIELETVHQFGLQHHTLGEALYQPGSSGHLVVSNIGSSGQDGVRSVPPEFPDFRIDSFFDVYTELVLDPNADGTAPPDAYVEFSASGPVHGGGVQPLGDLRLTLHPAGVHWLTADFSPIGSSTTRLEVYNGGTLVETFTGMQGLLAEYVEWPQEVGKLSSGWPPVLSCFVQSWPAPIQMEIYGPPGRGLTTTVTGDELRVLAEGGTPVDGVSSMSVRAADYSSIEIAGQSTVPASDTDGDGVPDAVDNCVLEANPDQCDTNGDGFGNRCDADLNNNGIVNTFDIGLLRAQLGATGANDADLDCNGIVNSFDLTRMRTGFGGPPGPSGQ